MKNSRLPWCEGEKPCDSVHICRTDSVSNRHQTGGYLIEQGWHHECGPTR